MKKLPPPSAKPDPAIILALANNQKKIIQIADSLKAHRVDGNVRYGVYGCTFKTINEVLSMK